MSLSWAKVTVSSDLLSHLLPGPVTTVFERRPELNPALNPRVPLVGVRIPEHHFVQQLVSRCGGPLALTSANVSQARSTLTAEVTSIYMPHTHTHTCTCLYTHIHARTHAHTHTRTCTCTCTYKHTYMYNVHTYTHNTHARTYPTTHPQHTHRHTQTHTHTHTHKFTHTHDLCA